MRQLLMILSAAFIATSAFAAAPKTFGGKITLTSPTPLAKAIESYDAFRDKDLLATGQIVKVCQKKGCWMEVKTDAKDVRVTFKDYGFFVPLNAAGKSVRLQGRIVKGEVSVADQKHYLEDAGAPKKDVDAVAAPKTEFSFVAAGVEIDG